MSTPLEPLPRRELPPIVVAIEQLFKDPPPGGWDGAQNEVLQRIAGKDWEWPGLNFLPEGCPRIAGSALNPDQLLALRKLWTRVVMNRQRNLALTSNPELRLEFRDFLRWVLDLLCGTPRRMVTGLSEENTPLADSPATPTTDSPAINKSGELILKVLLEHYPRCLTIQEVLRACAELSDRTIGPELNSLIRARLAHRPKGSRSGATLTDAGRNLARKLDASKGES
jgi:hypothetical protein